MIRPVLRRRALALLLAAATLPVLAGEVRVAASSSLRLVLPVLAADFESRSGHRLVASFGSSGLFTRQIERGAPFDLFLSADPAYVERLWQAGRSRDAGVPFAGGRLALFAAAALAADGPVQVADLPRHLAAGRLQRIAIAHPQHAPYGVAAREVLTAAGVWDELEAHLLIGENAAQAVRFVQGGNAEAGLVPMALVGGGLLDARGSVRPLEAAPAIEHRAVRIGPDSGEAAEALYAYLSGPSARRILTAAGFAPAGGG